jgi:hypothetical protein
MSRRAERRHTDLVNILERQSEGLVGRSRRGVNGINGIEEGDTLGGTGLGLLGPSLVPSHLRQLARTKSKKARFCRRTLVEALKVSEVYMSWEERSNSLQHVVSVPSRDGDEGDGDGVVSDLLDEALGLLDDLVESVLGPLAGVHLVASNDELPDTEGEGEQSVLSGLSVLGDTCLKLSDTGSDDEDSTIGLTERLAVK